MKNIFKRKRYRGKSKSPETKFKEKKARVDAYLLDIWLKQLRDDPALAQRISEQKYGSEAVIAYGDGEFEQPDLLSVLKQAKEAKDLLRDELGEKGSTIRDIAEILKSLPAVLQSLGQINPQALQQIQRQAISQPRIQQIAQPTQPEPEVQQPDLGEVKLEKLMALLELEPQQAWETLKAEGEAGWVRYLKSTTYEGLTQTLEAIVKQNPEYADNIKGFLKQYHKWLQNLITIAQQPEEK